MGLGSIIGEALGTKKGVDAVLNKDDGLLAKAGGWIGNQQYTDQEQAETRAETRKWTLRYLEAMEPFKKVQRILAFTFCFGWALLLLNLVAATWVWAITKEPQIFNGQTIWLGVNAMTPLLDLVKTNFVWTPILGVVTVYLFGGVMPPRKPKEGK